LIIDSGGNDTQFTSRIITKASTGNNDIAIGPNDQMGLTMRTSNIINVVFGGVTRGFFNATTFSYQKLRAASSSESFPGLSFNTDTNTGIHWPSDDTIHFSTGGVRAGFFDPNQNFYVTGNIQAERFIRPNNRKYTTSDINTDRVLDGADALAVVTDVLGTLIDDLKEVGIIG